MTKMFANLKCDLCQKVCKNGGGFKSHQRACVKNFAASKKKNNKSKTSVARAAVSNDDKETSDADNTLVAEPVLLHNKSKRTRRSTAFKTPAANSQLLDLLTEPFSPTPKAKTPRRPIGRPLKVVASVVRNRQPPVEQPRLKASNPTKKHKKQQQKSIIAGNIRRQKQSQAVRNALPSPGNGDHNRSRVNTQISAQSVLDSRVLPALSLGAISSSTPFPSAQKVSDLAKSERTSRDYHNVVSRLEAQRSKTRQWDGVIVKANLMCEAEQTRSQLLGFDQVIQDMGADDTLRILEASMLPEDLDDMLMGYAVNHDVPCEVILRRMYEMRKKNRENKTVASTSLSSTALSSPYTSFLDASMHSDSQILIEPHQQRSAVRQRAITVNKRLGEGGGTASCRNMNTTYGQSHAVTSILSSHLQAGAVAAHVLQSPPNLQSTLDIYELMSDEERSRLESEIARELKRENQVRKSGSEKASRCVVPNQPMAADKTQQPRKRSLVVADTDGLRDSVAVLESDAGVITASAAEAAHLSSTTGSHVTVGGNPAIVRISMPSPVSSTSGSNVAALPSVAVAANVRDEAVADNNVTAVQSCTPSIVRSKTRKRPQNITVVAPLVATDAVFKKPVPPVVVTHCQNGPLPKKLRRIAAPVNCSPAILENVQITTSKIPVVSAGISQSSQALSSVSCMTSPAPSRKPNELRQSLLEVNPAEFEQIENQSNLDASARKVLKPGAKRPAAIVGSFNNKSIINGSRSTVSRLHTSVLSRTSFMQSSASTVVDGCSRPAVRFDAASLACPLSKQACAAPLTSQSNGMLPIVVDSDVDTWISPGRKNMKIAVNTKRNKTGAGGLLANGKKKYIVKPGGNRLFKSPSVLSYLSRSRAGADTMGSTLSTRLRLPPLKTPSAELALDHHAEQAFHPED